MTAPEQRDNSHTLGVLGGLVAAYAGWQTIVTRFSVLLATGVSVTVGLIFGI